MSLSPLPQSPRPAATSAEALVVARREDAASREISDALGDDWSRIGSDDLFRAVRALREGRQAFLMVTRSYFEQCWCKIANDHGEAAATAWARGEGEPGIVDWYGKPGLGVDLGAMLWPGPMVVIDPPRAVRMGRAA